MRNKVVFCANKTKKLNALHPCVDTLKKKNWRRLSSNIWYKIFYCGIHRSKHSSFTNTTYDKTIFFAKEQINKSCKRYRNHVKSSSVYNVKNKIETKDLPQLDWPFSIKKPQFNRRIHNASSTLISPLLNWYERRNRIISFRAKVLPRCLTRVTENCNHSKVRKKTESYLIFVFLSNCHNLNILPHKSNSHEMFCCHNNMDQDISTNIWMLATRFIFIC